MDLGKFELTSLSFAGRFLCFMPSNNADLARELLCHLRGILLLLDCIISLASILNLTTNNYSVILFRRLL